MGRTEAAEEPFEGAAVRVDLEFLVAGRAIRVRLRRVSARGAALLLGLVVGDADEARGLQQGADVPGLFNGHGRRHVGADEPGLPGQPLLVSPSLVVASFPDGFDTLTETLETEPVEDVVGPSVFAGDQVKTSGEGTEDGLVDRGGWDFN